MQLYTNLKIDEQRLTALAWAIALYACRLRQNKRARALGCHLSRETILIGRRGAPGTCSRFTLKYQKRLLRLAWHCCFDLCGEYVAAQ